MLSAAGPSEATAGDASLVLSIVLPVAGILLSFLFGGRHAERIALILLPIGLAIASAIFIGARRHLRSACAVRILDPAAGDLERDEHAVRGERPLYPVCRAGAFDLCRRASC